MEVIKCPRTSKLNLDELQGLWPMDENDPVMDPDYKGRIWVTVVYPESATADWQDRLLQLNIPALVSPLHDKDINEGGHPVKPHWHVMFYFNNTTTFKHALDVARMFSGAVVKPCLSEPGYALYLTHKNRHEKHQYSEDDILAFNGASYEEAVATVTDVIGKIKEISYFIIHSSINNYNELQLFCMSYQPSWYKIVCSHTMHFRECFYNKKHGIQSVIYSPDGTEYKL